MFLLGMRAARIGTFCNPRAMRRMYLFDFDRDDA